MTRAQVLPVSIDEAEAIAAIVRPADRQEIAALGIELVEGLRTCFGESLKASKIVVAGEIVAVFGDAIHDAQAGIGVPWLISTIHVQGRNGRHFLKVCKPEVQEMLKRHRTLVNYVDARNSHAIRWLKWLGFSFGEPIPYGEKGMPFHPFNLSAGKACEGSDLFAG